MRGTYSESRSALASASKVLSSTITAPTRLTRTLLPGSATTRRTYPDMPSSPEYVSEAAADESSNRRESAASKTRDDASSRNDAPSRNPTPPLSG